MKIRTAYEEFCQSTHNKSAVPSEDDYHFGTRLLLQYPNSHLLQSFPYQRVFSSREKRMKEKWKVHQDEIVHLDIATSGTNGLWLIGWFLRKPENRNKDTLLKEEVILKCRITWRFQNEVTLGNLSVYIWPFIKIPSLLAASSSESSIVSDAINSVQYEFEELWTSTPRIEP